MFSKSFSIDGCIWVNKGEDCFLAPGRIVLLNAIVQEKSICTAAKKLGIPYQLAWKTFDQMNGWPHPNITRVDCQFVLGGRKSVDFITPRSLINLR